MDIYRYRFPSSGTADGMPGFTASILEDKLNNGPDSVDNYYAFQSKDKVVGKVSMEIDGSNDIISVNLFTIDKVKEGAESSLMECIQKNLAAVAWENYDDPKSCVMLNGSMEAIGVEYTSYIDKEWDDDFARAVGELPYGDAIIGQEQ